MTAFSILEKMFLKIENLMCALRAYINRTLQRFWDYNGRKASGCRGFIESLAYERGFVIP